MKLHIETNTPFRVSSIRHTADGDIIIIMETDQNTIARQTYTIPLDGGRSTERPSVSLTALAEAYERRVMLKEKTRQTYRQLRKYLTAYGDTHNTGGRCRRRHHPHPL